MTKSPLYSHSLCHVSLPPPLSDSLHRNDNHIARVHLHRWMLEVSKVSSYIFSEAVHRTPCEPGWTIILAWPNSQTRRSAYGSHANMSVLSLQHWSPKRYISRYLFSITLLNFLLWNLSSHSHATSSTKQWRCPTTVTKETRQTSRAMTISQNKKMERLLSQ